MIGFLPKLKNLCVLCGKERIATPKQIGRKMGSGGIVVETIGLTKVYGDGGEIRALDDVNLIMQRGEFVAVMGPSGSGKSTLLNMLGALDRPTAGRVSVGGQDLATLKDLDAFRATTVGFVFQLHNLIPTLTALENVEVPMQGYPSSGFHKELHSEKARRKRARELLELVGLGDRMNHLPGQLSGGQQQKVAIARALANYPAILLADEPTGNLDSASSDDLMGLLGELNHSQGVTIIVVTHDPRVARRAGRILTMRDGRIVDDHQVTSSLVEDLRDLARSQIGSLLLDGQPQQLDEVGLSEDGQLTPAARELRDILKDVL
jgi:ABC-type lipoprotein export system ATPase subunit